MTGKWVLLISAAALSMTDTYCSHTGMGCDRMLRRDQRSPALLESLSWDPLTTMMLVISIRVHVNLKMSISRFAPVWIGSLEMRTDVARGRETSLSNQIHFPPRVCLRRVDVPSQRQILKLMHNILIPKVQNCGDKGHYLGAVDLQLAPVFRARLLVNLTG